MLPDPFRLAGRVALVTGAGAPDGIGLSAARLLGALGARVAVAATTNRVVERAAELEAAGIASVGVVADLTQEDQVLHAGKDRPGHEDRRVEVAGERSAP